ncbi:MAG: FAD-dependent oxidoreductase [Geminicoccaceae bacterium]
MNDVIACDIAIVGGGHAGLLTALALAERGFVVRVIDPAGVRTPPPSGRTLALLAGSRTTLERLGLWRHVAHIGWPVHRVDVRDGASGGHVVYRSTEVGGGPLAHGVDNSELRGALATALPSSLWIEGRLASMPGRGRLRLEDGRTIEAGLVIGADGRGSLVRRLARIGLERWAYRQSALSFVITHERDSRHLVLERFRPEGLARHAAPSAHIAADNLGSRG